MVPVAQFGTQLFSHTWPVPAAAVLVQLVQARFWTPMPLSAHAITMPVGSTVDCWPCGGGDVHCQMTLGIIDPGAGLVGVVAIEVGPAAGADTRADFEELDSGGPAGIVDADAVSMLAAGDVVIGVVAVERCSADPDDGPHAATTPITAQMLIADPSLFQTRRRRRESGAPTIPKLSPSAMMTSLPF